MSSEQSGGQVILRYALAWIPMVFLAIANGLLREQTFGRVLPELRAHQLSTLTGVLIFAVYTWVLSLKWPLHSSAQALGIGGLWCAFTVAFEFLFGRYVMHHPWSRLLHDYNLFAGRLWVLVLASVALLPWMVFKIRS